MYTFECVTISDDLTWKRHIENIAAGAEKLLDAVNALKQEVSRQYLGKM